MLNTFFEVYYLICFILGSFIRVWYSRKYKQDRKAILREEGLAYALLASLWGVAILLPVVYMFTGWPSFADYGSPSWAGWFGVAIFTMALWLLWRSHTDLGQNWRLTTELREDHTLNTDGIFQYIRHPMYSAHWLWGIAQVLLIQNWIAGLASLVIFIPIYMLRVRREEHMMLEQFGEEYRIYMSHTGRIFPHISK
ncbi:protein-S-isoprenylcysteine O-methyltransferase [Chloroflexota bacterium]